MRKERNVNLVSDERILEELNIEPLHESDAILWILFGNEHTIQLGSTYHRLQDGSDTQVEKEGKIPFHRKSTWISFVQLQVLR